MNVCAAHNGWSRTASGAQFPSCPGIIFLHPGWDLCPLWWTLEAKIWSQPCRMLWQVLQYFWAKCTQNNCYSIRFDILIVKHIHPYFKSIIPLLSHLQAEIILPLAMDEHRDFYCKATCNHDTFIKHIVMALSELQPKDWNDMSLQQKNNSSCCQASESDSDDFVPSSPMKCVWLDPYQTPSGSHLHLKWMAHSTSMLHTHHSMTQRQSWFVSEKPFGQ